MLFNEPKLLKSAWDARRTVQFVCFSALQRAEIAEMARVLHASAIFHACFSALQRAEIAEIATLYVLLWLALGFSALQRAEIAEIVAGARGADPGVGVSVLFNEPKLLKFKCERVEGVAWAGEFQCSSTSRNC